MKKNTAKKRRKVVRKCPKARRHNSQIIIIALLFSCGIMLGAVGLNRIYLMHEEASSLAFAERLAAEQAHALKIRQQRLDQQAQQKALIASKSQVTNQPAVVKKTAGITTSQIDLNIAQVTEQPTANDAPIRRLDANTPVNNDLASRDKPNNKPLVQNKAFESSAFSSYTPPLNSNIVAIVIDDVGYQKRLGERTVALPGKITLAILPFTPFADQLARQGSSLGKEIMLHAPMEPKKLSYWGDGLKASMQDYELRKELVAMINNIPHLAGVNNHMGSRLTENSVAMESLMQEISPRGLYFIDSRTTPNSAAYRAARRAGIPTYVRDIFLDHSRNPHDIDTQFNKLMRASKRKGIALGIGHPYPETLNMLEKRLPELKAQGIELVTVSELLNAKQSRRKAVAKSTIIR